MRTLLIFLSLSLAALGQALPQDWLVMPADLKAYLPPGYRIDKSLEKVRAKNMITMSFSVVSYTDRKKHIAVASQLSRNQSSLRAELSYATQNFAVDMTTGRFKSSVDYSKQIRAGEASECKRLAENFWSFRYRKKRVSGFLMIAGIRLTPQQMKKVVDNWVGRVDALQVRKKSVKQEGLWPFR